MGRFHFRALLRGLGRSNAALTKKLNIGVNPSGMNYYTHIGFTYDEGKRCCWRLYDGLTTGGSFIAPLDHPYIWPENTGHSQMGWNTTTDASQLQDVAESGPLRNTIKMSLDGTIDMTTLPAGTTQLWLNLPSYFDYPRQSETFQVQFSTPVPGATFSGTGFVAGSWVNEDGGVGALWRFTLSGLDTVSLKIAVPNNSTAVPSLTIRRPRIVPHPTLGSTRVSPEPVGYPPEVAKWKKVGRIIRTLDLGRVNYCTINGDTLSQMRYRTAQPTDYLFGSLGADAGQPRITLAEMVTIANEANCGLWVTFGHRDSQALILQHANTLKGLNGQLVVEFSNEVWNTGFIQNTETIYEGLRRGFADTLFSATATPQTLLLPYRHTTSTSTTALNANDKVIVILSGYGTCVFRARTALPSGTAFPAVWAGSNTAYPTVGTTVVANYPMRAVYQLVQPIAANQNILLTNTSYWKQTTDADAATAPWDLVYTSTDAAVAREHWRAYMTNFITDACNAARAAVGKPAAVQAINVQVSVTSVRGDATGTNAASNTEPARMLEFDSLWRRNPLVCQSIYLLNDQFPSSQQPWTYSHSFTSANGIPASLTAADKQQLYSDPSPSLTQVNLLADKMLSDNMVAYMRDNIRTRRISFVTGTTYNLTRFINDQRLAWNAAHPGDIVAAITPRVGEYEVGIECGTTGRGSPDEASQWSSGANYTAGYTQASFAKYPSGSSAKLYRAKGTPTQGVNPLSDPANWEEMQLIVDTDGNSHTRMGALMNAIYKHPKAYDLLRGVLTDHIAYANSAQGGVYYSNVYATIRQMAADVTSAFGYRFDNPGDQESKSVSPAWAAAVDNFTDWQALP